jgi:glycosyltransferase involved in cell wall biosynthesis
VPVLAFAVGGLPEVVHEGETGYLVPFGDTERLARKIGDVLSDRSQVQRIIEQSQKRVRPDYDVTTMARRYDELYRTSQRSLRDR